MLKKFLHGLAFGAGFAVASVMIATVFWASGTTPFLELRPEETIAKATVILWTEYQEEGDGLKCVIGGLSRGKSIYRPSLRKIGSERVF